MAETVELSRDLAYVEAEVSYVVDDGSPSIRYIDWPEEAHNEHLPTYETRKVRILNGRLAEEPFDLAAQGFKLVTRPTAMKSFFDEDEVLRVYYPETERLILDESGARRVVVFDHTIRTTDSAHHAERWIRPTVHSVHNDYTERSAPKRVRDILPGEADDLLTRRYGIIQVWRSIAPVVETEPLALADGRTIPPTGFIRNERRYRDRNAETYSIAYNPAHRFYYFPLMTRDEAIVFKVFDSDPSVGTPFTGHTAFTDPTSPLDAAPRESIEMRALAFY